MNGQRAYVRVIVKRKLHTVSMVGVRVNIKHSGSVFFLNILNRHSTVVVYAKP